MRKIRILWTDDEIDVLKAHIIFLSDKGYDVHTCSNGTDTIDLVRINKYDILFLDQNMPGLSGIDTLREIKKIRPEMPVVMITKSEDELVMEMAIGSQIADYLIKPVKPKQILLSLKKNIDSSRLVTQTTTSDYRSEFGLLADEINRAANFNDWYRIYRTIVYWDTRLDKVDDPGLRQIFELQERDANNSFTKFIASEYASWFSADTGNSPVLSPSVMPGKIFPLLKNNQKVFFIVIDNLRLDQWKIISEEIAPIARIEEDDLYFSILPTATQYARNSIFAGLMPADIKKLMPGLWVNEDDEEGKNNFERELLAAHLQRENINCKWSYNKIGSNTAGRKINDKLGELLNNDLNVLVYNFIDMLSHARTEIGLIRDLADNEAAYRTLTRSWFIHSPLAELLKELKGQNIKIVITTDHGTVRVNNPVKVIGDRKSSTNIRYKTGRNLDYDPEKVFAVKHPSDIHLPGINISSSFIFARAYDYLVYPKNYNHFARYYKNTFQHGGISLHEMIIPLATLSPLP